TAYLQLDALLIILTHYTIPARFSTSFKSIKRVRAVFVATSQACRLGRLTHVLLLLACRYLPPYTTWLPFGESSSVKDHPREETQGVRLLKSTLLSQLSYLAIFVIAICVTEREKLKEDPLNFNLLSIVVEVVSAYGNVGFSMGYSCSRQISPDGMCTDRWTGFAGRWSDSGKLILILVMLFGRMKKFSMKAGKSWKLS
uniref:Cation transporter HKT7 n=1 Tax=Aegilops tauschii subsp. strangulata TaxID=200361 RepID=A0A453CSU8_AEGTS